MVARRKPGQKPPPQQSAKPWFQKPFNTKKGSFTMTLVSDGVYVEHSWGQANCITSS